GAALAGSRRKPDLRLRTLPFPTFDHDLAAGLAHDLPRRGEAKAGARWTSGVERLERSHEDRRRHPCAGVANMDTQVLSRREHAVGVAQRLRERYRIREDADHGLGRSRMVGIAAQVEEYLLHLHRIDQ